MTDEAIRALAAEWAARVQEDRDAGWSETEVPLAAYFYDAIREAVQQVRETGGADSNDNGAQP